MHILRSLIVMAPLLLSALMAHAEDASQVRAELTAKLANLQDKQIRLNNAATAITKREDAEQERGKTLSINVDKWKQNDQKLKSELDRYNDQVGAHNGRCGGTYTDQSYVDRCNAKKADLDAWEARIKEKFQTSSAQKTSLFGQAKTLEDDMKETAERRARNIIELAAVASAMESIRRALDDKFLNDLKSRNALSQDCLHKGSDEAIVECMKGVFDGARVQ